MRLLADIGGTNIRFALLADGPAQPERELSLRCADFDGLEQAVRHYLAQVGRPARSARLPSMWPPPSPATWSSSPTAPGPSRSSRPSVSLGLNRLLVLNDFTALALSLPMLAPGELRQVGRGSVRCPRRRSP